MRIERIILIVVWVMLGAGIVALATGGIRHLNLGIWLFFGALAVMSLPLLIWIINWLAGHQGKKADRRQ